MRVSGLAAFRGLALGAVLSTGLMAFAANGEWVPSGLDAIGRGAAFHTDFTFDRAMLQVASGLIDGGDEETRRAIAKLDGVSVHVYKFAQAGMYDPQALNTVREQYRAAGWKHLVSSQKGVVPPTKELGPSPERTDLFLRFEGTNVVGMVAILEGERNLNVIALTGNLSPLDLLHLRGHFGIPKFAGDTFVPARPN